MIDYEELCLALARSRQARGASLTTAAAALVARGQRPKPRVESAPARAAWPDAPVATQVLTGDEVFEEVSGVNMIASSISLTGTVSLSGFVESSTAPTHAGEDSTSVSGTAVAIGEDEILDDQNVASPPLDVTGEIDVGNAEVIDERDAN